MRVLFVLGSYFPRPSANGVCVARVQESLYKMGIPSDVVCEGGRDTNPYGEVYPVCLQNTQNVSRIKRLSGCLLYPVYFPANVGIFSQAIDKALSEHSYDAVIAVLRPVDGAIAAAGYTNLLIYELDSIANNYENEHGYRTVLRHRSWWVERYLYRRAGHIFHMLSHRQFYQQKRYDPFIDKSSFLDIPQMVNEEIGDEASREDGKIRILYSGTLHDKMRSPEYAVSLFKELISRGKQEIEVNFYSSGNCEEFLENTQKETDGAVKRHGFVSLAELNRAVARTDILLSIGNASTGKVTSLPSKVISYMAYGKPIIHIDAGKNDVAKDYLNRYPLAVVINPTADFRENYARLSQFVGETPDRRVPFDVVRKSFEMNTPEYTAEKIKQTILECCSGTVNKRKP